MEKIEYTKLSNLVDKPISIAVLERVFSKVNEDDNGCWVYSGHTNNGYGHKSYKWFGKSYAMTTHRMVWEAQNGRKATVLNHLCRNRACCNPKHLEETTIRDNIIAGISNSAINYSKTKCVAGHEFNDTNTRYYIKNGNTVRACRVCALDWYHNNKNKETKCKTTK